MISRISSYILVIALFSASTILGKGPPLYSGYAVQDKHPVPNGWSRVGPAPAEHLIKLQIGLKQSNFNELERHLYEGM